MSKKSIYIILSTFIFLLGYVSSDLVEAYETRDNQYPPYGKEVVDINGTKFMRDIIDEKNENEDQTIVYPPVLEKKQPSGCESTSSLSEENSCLNLFDNQYSVWFSSNNMCQDETITFTFNEPIYLEFIVFQNPKTQTVFEESIIVEFLDITLDNNSKYLISKKLEYDNISQWIDINSEINHELTLKIVKNYPQNINNQESRCSIEEVRFYGRSLNR